jgi:hypothetical protein
LNSRDVELCICLHKNIRNKIGPKEERSPALKACKIKLKKIKEQDKKIIFLDLEMILNVLHIDENVKKEMIKKANKPTS